MSGARILIVDDDPDVLSLLAETLRSQDYEPLIANNIAEAREALMSGTVNLIISDLDMPEMSGVVLRTHLAALPQFRDIPFVLITAREAWGDRWRAEKLGVQRFLNKPIDRAALFACLQELLPLPPQSAPLSPLSQPPAQPSIAARLSEDSQVALLVSVQDLMKSQRDIPPADAFVVSQLAGGKMEVRELLALCPQPPAEVMVILARLIALGVVTSRS